MGGERPGEGISSFMAVDASGRILAEVRWPPLDDAAGGEDRHDEAEEGSGEREGEGLKQRWQRRFDGEVGGGCYANGRRGCCCCGCSQNVQEPF